MKKVKTQLGRQASPQTTCVGTVFRALREHVVSCDPSAFKELVGEDPHDFLANIANHQKAVGRLLTLVGDLVGDDIAPLGWLVAALAEMSICWQEIASPVLLKE